MENETESEAGQPVTRKSEEFATSPSGEERSEVIFYTFLNCVSGCLEDGQKCRENETVC